MAFLLVWTPEEGALWIKGLRVRPAPAEGAFDPAA
jgi:hypothetical protein